jgi:hypothetical protein
MGISRSLRKRIETDAKASDYWYVPKGQTVSADNWDRIAEHLRVLAKFQTMPWENAQRRYARELLRRKLIEPYKVHKTGFSPVARMQLPVWRLLGLAWLNTSHIPEITEVGREFVAARSTKQRRELLTMQLHRYQFANPSNPPHFANFRTFPVIALYRLLQHVDCNRPMSTAGYAGRRRLTAGWRDQRWASSATSSASQSTSTTWGLKSSANHSLSSRWRSCLGSAMASMNSP